MKLKIEAIADLVPSVRAEIARELSAYGLSQQEISSLLGVSQPAVSQYLRQLRGYRYQEESIKKEVRLMCDKLAKGVKNDLEDDIYRVCKMIVENKVHKSGDKL